MPYLQYEYTEQEESKGRSKIKIKSFRFVFKFLLSPLTGFREEASLRKGSLTTMSLRTLLILSR